MTTEELVRSIDPLLSDIGYRYYFAPETVARAMQLGLDVSGFYFLGRGGLLGDVEASVVSSAFGYFNPELVSSMWEAGRAVVAPRDAGREHLACCAGFGRRYLADVPGLEAFCAAAETVDGAARRSVGGLTQYAAMTAAPRPDDLPARAMHLSALLREHRGSVHLLAVVGAGLDPAVAHYLRRPTAWGLFGWHRAQVPTVTGLDRRRLDEVDRTTDRLLVPSYGVLDEESASALVTGARAIQAAVGDVGTAPA